MKCSDKEWAENSAPNFGIAPSRINNLRSVRPRHPQVRGCEWSRCLVLQISIESELLQVAQAVKDNTKMRQTNFFMQFYSLLLPKPSDLLKGSPRFGARF